MKQLLITLILISLVFSGCSSHQSRNLNDPTKLLTDTTTPTESIRPNLSSTATNTNMPAPTETPTIDPNPTETPIPQERPDYDTISGTYVLERGNDAGCSLKVVFERTAPFDNVQLELLCSRGAPSYNSGYALVNILTADNISVLSPNAECNIVFQFTGDQVIVTQIGLDFDCGFGHGVYANGTYTLTDSHLPVLGCMARTNPCNLQVP